MRTKTPKLATALLVTAAFLLGLAQCTGSPSAHGKITIGKDTTYVTSPINPDGTVDYVAAYNQLVEPPVKPEANAAIPLLQATVTETAWNLQREKDLFMALDLPKPDTDNAVNSLFGYAQSTRDAATPEALDQISSSIRKFPWTPAEYPLADKWLTAKATAFRLLEQAAERPDFYMPMIAKGTPSNFSESLQAISQFHDAFDGLITRAMRRAGQGDIAAALADLQRAQQLKLFLLRGGVLVKYLVAQAADVNILSAYHGLLSRTNVSRENLRLISDSLNQFQIVPDFNYRTAIGERFDTLDVIMCLARGDGEKVFLPAYALLAPSPAPDHIDLGNLDRCDWNIVLRETNLAFDQAPVLAGLSRDQRLALLNDRKKRSIDEKWPQSGIFEGSDPSLSGVKPLEAFLKLRHGESGAEYSHRIGRWLGAQDAVFDRRNFTLHARDQAAYDMAVLAAQLAQYHFDYNAYPEALAALDSHAHEDPITGKPLGYRREVNGYVLWSVGLNEKDDNATGDDMVISVEK